MSEEGPGLGKAWTVAMVANAVMSALESMMGEGRMGLEVVGCLNRET